VVTRREAAHGITEPGILSSGHYNMTMVKSQVPAATFKARCLQIMDDVQQHRREVVITKRGVPVAKLVPVEAKAPQVLDCMAGSARIVGDILAPVVDPGEWESLK
jgi:prevent-host-death family protein